MSLIVCKFGGTSVASPERIQMVAKKLIAKKQAGHDVVAVVSAMGKTTDELVGLAAALNDNPPLREMDRLLSTGEQVSMSLLAMAIEARGYKAMSFTGRQAGIETDKFHNKAKIVMVHSERVRDALERGAIAVVAGFQGVDRTYYEAAAVDGVRNRWQELYYITLPNMKPMLMFGAVMSITSAFGVCDVPMALAGFPSTDYAAHTVVTHLFDYGFTRFEMGYASAIATLLFLVMILCNKLIQSALRRIGT